MQDCSQDLDIMPRNRKSRTARVDSRTVNFALQGGGAHGAFTWGVLDRLLEDERINIEGISATSAGALNATVLTLRLCGGRPRRRQGGARTVLEAHQPRGDALAAAAELARPCHGQPLAA